MSKPLAIAVAVAALLGAFSLWFYQQFSPEIEDSEYVVTDAIDNHVNDAAMDNGKFYGKSPWSGAHRDNRNSDYVPLPTPDAMRRTWRGIEGASFFMGPVIGPDGSIYATSAQGQGHSHLHAYDTRGNLKWKSKPMEDWDDLDPAAFLSAAVFDEDGHIFLADSNQLWSFDADGDTRWVTDLPALGVNGYVFSVYFTHTGHTGIISGDGQVALFDRATGTLAMPILNLPGVAGLPASPMPPGLFADGSIDERIVQDSWDAVFGFNMEVANTPSVHSETGRIFIVATGAEPDTTVLYGIDVLETGLEIAFETALGRSGSGTSPPLSFDGRFVYVIDGDGHLTGINTDTGEIAWKSEETAVTGVSSATAPDGRIYTFDLNYLFCWDGSNGDVIWKRDLREIAEQEVPWWASWYGRPHASLVSGFMVAEDGFWAVLQIGTDIPIPIDRQGQIQPPIASLDVTHFAQPTEYFLVHYDFDGNLTFKTPFVDAAALLAMGLDGRIYVTTFNVSGSIAYYGANQDMPFFMRSTPKPYGGLIAYEPVSFLDYFEERVRWHASDTDSPGLQASLQSLHLILDEAHDKGELGDDDHEALMTLVRDVQETAEKEGFERILAAL